MANSSIYYTPQQIITAYEINKIVTPNNKPRGYGIKVGIILAYHNSNLQDDLTKYCLNYSQTVVTLSIINQAGNTTNSDWGLEGSISTQMIASIAPGAEIYVIEAKDNTLNSITNAIKTPENLECSVIHMGFGCPEFSGQTSLENYFTNQSIVYVASSGNTSNVVNYPSSSPNVCSVGGTTLTINQNYTRLNETTCDSSGNGPSIYESLPTYQNNISNITVNKRVTPDVAFVADNKTGFVIFSGGSYYSTSGTSVSTAIFSGFLAISNQLRKSSSKKMLTTVALSTSNQLQKYMYQNIYANNANNSNYTQGFYDIINGNNGIYSATIVYDYCCGLGSGNANSLCNQLINA